MLKSDDSSVASLEESKRGDSSVSPLRAMSLREPTEPRRRPCRTLRDGAGELMRTRPKAALGLALAGVEYRPPIFLVFTEVW